MIAIASDAFNCFIVIIVGRLGAEVRHRTIFQVAFQDNCESLLLGLHQPHWCDINQENNMPFLLAKRIVIWLLTYKGGIIWILKRASYPMAGLEISLKQWQPQHSTVNYFFFNSIMANINFTFSIFIFCFSFGQFSILIYQFYTVSHA